MATGRIYQRKSGNWAIDYSVGFQRKRETIGSSKKLAQAVLHKRLGEVAENKHLDIEKIQKIKFKDFAETYIEVHSKPNKRSWKSSDSNSLTRLKPIFGEKFLDEITPFMIEQFRLERSKSVSGASVNRELTCLKTMFNKAIDWGKAKENPVKKVKFFKENNARTRYLEKEEIEKLLSNCSESLRHVVIFALNTGMRKGEIQRLKWTDIDFQRSVIAVRETKNGEDRYAPMNQAVKNVLASVRKHPDSEYIFCSNKGFPYNFRKSFETALDKSEIKDFRFHDLRHSYASHLVMSGVDLNTVRELLGHKSLSMTLRYSHLSQNHKMRAVELLDQRFDNKIDTSMTPQTNSEESTPTIDSLIPLAKAS